MESKIVCTQRKNDFSLKMAESKPVLGVSPPLLLLTISILLATNVGGNLIEFLTSQYNPNKSCSYTDRSTLARLLGQVCLSNNITPVIAG